MENCDMKVLIIIVNAGFSDHVICMAREAGAVGATILNARGEGGHHKLFMGITVDSEREMIMCLVDECTADKVMTAIKEKAGIKTSFHGICFTMPVEQMIGVSPAPQPEK